ncbi:hypothetical protein NKJ36_29225 [Mesorhizobium sp. M0142]|uniref:hypothetical protein n=1 Tax=Mesorhizobium sp. M0142 TaxID=2956894 RepID=UPI003335ED75
MTEASVVISAHTLDRWLNVATASVRRQARPAREIIVVIDNNEALLERARREINGVVVTATCAAVARREPDWRRRQCWRFSMRMRSPMSAGWTSC